MNILDDIKLDKDQIEAIKEENNTIIIAGAGSGKTTTLTGKIKYLVDTKKVDPNKIIMISFTNKATNELIDRINIKYKIPVLITTFHKLSLKIIKKQYHPNIVRNQETIVSLILEANKKVLKKHTPDKLTKEVVNEITLSLNKYKEFKSTPNFLIEFVYTKYQQYLKENNLIDFVDMIKIATKVLKTNKCVDIDYLIIDEYQDISNIRFEFIKAIHEATNCKIIVVGDDWQSIFAFAGSNINLFYEFEKTFKAKKKFIRNTYRNSQELIDVASNFIMKNKNQIPKKLISNKTLKQPILIKYYYKNIVKATIKTIDHILKEKPSPEILLLGRYTFDINPFLESKHFIYNKQLKYKTLPLTFLTIHSAKGLGFDCVIIINGDDKKYGFPAKKADIEEERRLFYVALTRTKNKVYIVSNRFFPSVFVKEIRKDKNVRILH